MMQVLYDIGEMVLIACAVILAMPVFFVVGSIGFKVLAVVVDRIPGTWWRL